MIVFVFFSLANIPQGGYPIPLLSDGSDNDADDILDSLNADTDVSDDNIDDEDEDVNGIDDNDDNDSWEDLDVQEENL